MRYAAPPLGNLRWRAPVEPERSTLSWEPALAFQPVCLGNAVGPPYLGEDEDCLFVNVWAPSNATDASRLPVWVFIQGGGYVFNSNANYDGAEVVEKSGHNIVMVNFNYRVGVWGFLASERLRVDGDLNVGLLDQRRLLLWVKQYISRFGGDPDHVVIHGASAGAGSVALHLSAYGGRDDGLFVGAISESLFFPAQPYVHELEWQFDRVLQAVGCYSYDSAAAMACLRSQDMETLQSLNIALAFPGRTAPPNPLFYWTPCIDGDFIQDLPDVLFETGRFLKMPVIFGTDTDEGSAFATNAASPADIISFFQDNYPLLTLNDTLAILSHYPQVLPLVPYHNPWFPTASLAYGEATFVCPSLNLLSHITSYTPASNNSNSIFAYRYNVLDAVNLAAGIGVPHIFEAAAVFGPGNLPPVQVAASYFTYNAPVVPLVMGYWISFVRALDPNVYRAAGAPVWEGWDGKDWGGGGGRRGQRLKIELGDTCMEDVGEEESGRCEFWEGMGRSMRQRRRKRA
ncbi:Alpha/Beta hydrolase protein [Coniochaeta sp. 2T2.1]|nr:Alpha/Beta hydrolase protein [Coniochaeta sp. 2T2.1]